MLVANRVAVDLSRPDNSEYVKGRSPIVIAIWHFLGAPLLRSHWVPISAFKCSVLRLFGAQVGRGVYIKPGVRVKFPWYLKVGDYCWIGEDVWIDNLCPVTVGSHVCVSQGAYLCTGNHDWTARNMKLFLRPIELQDGCWVGARAMICPGTRMATAAVVTAGSVAGGEVPEYQIWSGNPARYMRDRNIAPAAEFMPHWE